MVSSPKPKPLTYSQIKRLCGDIPDWKISAMERCDATLEDLEIAFAWAAGESDVMGEALHPLMGKARLLYDILKADEEAWENYR